MIAKQKKSLNSLKALIRAIEVARKTAGYMQHDFNHEY